MNILRTSAAASEEPCPRVEGRERIAAEFSGHLTDESRTSAPPVDVIFFPETLGQVCAVVRECARRGLPLTVSGARTGIVGGAVPVGSRAVVAMERLARVRCLRYDARRGEFFARVEAGVLLSRFQEMLRATPPEELPWPDGVTREAGAAAIRRAGRRLFYPVDPTETSAQIGGTVATNASGARTFHYGPTRAWVEGLTVVLAAGEVLPLRRGEVTAADGRFVLRRQDRQGVIAIPALQMPATKHAAGYFLRPDMDAVDLFVGSEGTLGIVVEAELRLAFEPAERLFLTAFPAAEGDALRFVQGLRRRRGDGLRPLAIEYFDPGALDLLREKRRAEGTSSGVPPLGGDARCAIYTELAFDGDEELRACHAVLCGLLGEAGVAPERAWAGFSRPDGQAMKAFRHALPELVNGIIGRRKKDVPALHKVGTDMAVPDERLQDVMALYRAKLDESGLEYVIFGHIGDNHLHVNILPRTEEELGRAKGLYKLFAREVVAMGGSVSAEHGIGRIKRDFLRVQFGEETVAGMRALKAALDPAGLLNPGVLF